MCGKETGRAQRGAREERLARAHIDFSLSLSQSHRVGGSFLSHRHTHSEHMWKCDRAVCEERRSLCVFPRNDFLYFFISLCVSCSFPRTNMSH